MKKRGPLVIERIHMVDPILNQDGWKSVCEWPQLGADGATTMAKVQDGLLIDAFLDGRNRRILSVHQHLRPQQKEVAVIAGVDMKVRIHLNVYHRDSEWQDSDQVIDKNGRDRGQLFFFSPAHSWSHISDSLAG